MVRGVTAIAAMTAFLAFSGSHAAEPEDAGSLEALSEEIVVAPDASFRDTVHAEYRATNDAGALQVSRVSLFYDSEMQEVEILEAHTLKRDGSKIPVDVSTIYEQLPPDNALAVTSFRVKILLFPQFSAGDTAVYTVRYKTAKPYFPNAFYFGKSFPRTLAFKNVRISVTAPKAMKLRIENHEVPFHKEDHGDSTVYTWQIDAPKGKAPLPVAVSPMDREPRFFASSFKDYAELGAAYAAQSAPHLAVTTKTQALADQITAGTSDRREQTRKIYEWVAKQIRYVAIELGRGSFVPHDADAILAKGYGDCKDHDALLQTLLKAKGIAAQSILINAENAYTLTEAPTFGQLNHVITFVPEFGLYLDSTAAAPFATLPLSEYGKPAVRASASNPAQITMPVLAPGIAGATTTTTAVLDDKGVLSGSTKITAMGPYAITLRYAALAIQAYGAENVAKAKLTLNGLTDPSGSFTMDPPMELTPTYSLTGKFTAKGLSGWLEKSEARGMPTGLRLAGAIGDGVMGPLFPGELPDTEATVCVSSHEVEDISIQLPPGTRPLEIPDDLKVETANLSFLGHWSFKDGKLAVHREFTGKMTQALCTGAIRKQSAEALKKIADGYDAAIRLTRSVADFDRSLKENPKDVEALIQRGNEHTDKHEYDLALKDFGDALALSPKSAWAMNARGATYIDMGKLDLALADLEHALALEPDYELAWYNHGLVRLRQMEWDKAIADFDAALKLTPSDANALLDRGHAFMDQGKFDRALTDFNAALVLKPDEARGYGSRAAVRLATNKAALALTDCNESLKRDPKAAWVLVIRANAQRMLGNNEAARLDYNAAMELAPNDPDTLRAHSYYLNATRQLDRALLEINALIALAPTDASAYLLRGDAHRAQGQLDLALADYAKAIALKPDMTLAQAGRLDVLVEMNKIAQAQQDCQALIATYPDKGWPYLVCSRVKRATGDQKGANQDVDKGFKRDPNLASLYIGSSVPAVSVTSVVRSTVPPELAAFAEGSRLFASGDYEQAATALERADKVSQNSVSVLPLLCLALSHTAKTADAAYQCARALQNAPNDERLLEAHSKILLRQGKYSDALADAEILVAHNPKVARYQRLRDEAKAGKSSK
ncbi:MAG: tetratricopeptide repeat protein [Rhizomicrobium sp.]|nr:tetratricopeptide repeat protein [Rhizomicrobium sp.]